MVTSDHAHIARMRQALARLKQARSYQQQAARMVKDAEMILKAAMEAVYAPSSPDGERKDVAA